VVASVALHTRSGQDAEYSDYHSGPFQVLCVAHVRLATYEKSARAATFLYNQLIEDSNMEAWTYIPRPWLVSHTSPADLDLRSLDGLVGNCYLTFPNVLAAAMASDMQLIRIGTQRKSLGRKPARATRPDAKGHATHGVASEAEVEAGGGDRSAASADEADGSAVKGGSTVEGGGSDSNGTAGGTASSTAVSPPLLADGRQPAVADRAGAGRTPGAVCPQHAGGPPSPAVPATAAAAGPTGADQPATSGQTGDGPTGGSGSSAPGPIGQRLSGALEGSANSGEEDNYSEFEDEKATWDDHANFRLDPTFAAKLCKAIEKNAQAKRKKQPQMAISMVVQEHKAMRVARAKAAAALMAAPPADSAASTVTSGQSSTSHESSAAACGGGGGGDCRPSAGRRLPLAYLYNYNCECCYI
jgi:hypothetical protein